MEVATIMGEKRTAIGRNQVARLRAVGKVPAVIYGGDKEPTHVAFGRRDVEQELRKHHRVFKLNIDGEVEAVYMQDVQYDVLTDEARHLDFRRIDLLKPIDLDVELVFLGHPAGASKGGVLVKDLHRLHVKSLPAAVPHEIQVPVLHLDLGMHVLAQDLDLPEGVTLDEPGDTMVCHMPTAAAVAAAALAAEAAEAAVAESAEPTEPGLVSEPGEESPAAEPDKD